VGIVSLSCATVLDWAMGPYTGKETGEAALLWTLREPFKPGDVVIADRLYASYFMIARLRLLGVDVVMRQHQSRHTDFRRGKRLGARDHVVEWERPARPTWMAEAEYADMPATLSMREVRAGGWTLVSTLTNAKAVSKRELLDLYHSRWHVELDFRSIKDAMQMDVLRCKTAEMVRKEVAVHLFAYNLIRTVMARAAHLARVLPRRMSFKAGLQTLNAFFHALRLCSQRKLPKWHARILASIARLLLPVRPNRVEPRAVKRRPKPHRLLTEPRTVARARLEKQQRRIMAAFG
jgi:Transposase DDE domain